jgi:hypothetical protein
VHGILEDVFMKRVCSVLVAALLMASAAWAQSLADLARQERERRKAVKAPARVYTDADVDKASPLTTAAARQAKPAAAGTAEAGTAGAETPADGTSRPPESATTKTREVNDEAAWRGRLERAREELARSRRLLSAMEAQLVSMGIRNHSAALAGRPVTDRTSEQEASKEVARLRGEVEKAFAALARVEADARDAGIPPGWLR